MPLLSVEAIGYGLGTRDTPDRPNALRAVIGRAEHAVEETVSVIETQLDDTTPEILSAACDRLRDAGALDVTTTALTMKKGRTGQLLTVLASSAQVEELADVIFEETTTFGVRIRDERRIILDRELITVDTAFGSVAVKVGRRAGRTVQIQPEFESCRAAAGAASVPVRRVFEAAAAAARALLDKP